MNGVIVCSALSVARQYDRICQALKRYLVRTNGRQGTALQQVQTAVRYGYIRPDAQAGLEQQAGAACLCNGHSVQLDSDVP